MARARRSAQFLVAPSTPSPSQQDAQSTAAVEDRDEMVRAMRQLTPHQRAALVLTGYLGYTSEDAAKLLGIRASTVRALATKGRATARATLEGRR